MAKKVKGQLSFNDMFEDLFPHFDDSVADFVRDVDCSVQTPVVFGKPASPIYGTGVCIEPRVPGRRDSEHFKEIYLPELLPLEEYDKIIVLFSGGKDSLCAALNLLELGVPKEKIELWHHDIDGGHPSRRMDWRCTSAYVKSFAEAMGIKLVVSYRVNGFFGELYRLGASEPIEWIDPDTGEVLRCKESPSYKKCEELKKTCTEELEEKLKEYGHRYRFPAKSADLSRRWCSAYLKVMVASSVIANIDQLETKHAKLLIVSGERRGESPGRSHYNEMEVHRTNTKSRLVHQWRNVIDWSERDIWECMKRHNINPHPCYRAGWNRCSCAMCIFSTPTLFAGIKELYPEEYEALVQDEKILGFTLDNKCDLNTFVGDAKSCVVHKDHDAVQSLLAGQYTPEQIYVKGEWHYPAGAFHGAAGGPC